MKRIINSVVLSLCLLLGAVPVYADQTFTTEGQHDVPVDLTVGSLFTVGIPTQVTMSIAGEASYTMEVSGDIDPRKQLNVVPRDEDASKAGITINMKRSNTTQIIPAQLTNPDHAEDAYQYSELEPNDPIESTISLKTYNNQRLTPGTWQGIITYDIELADK